MSYEIGQFYKVPCVHGQWENVIADWPVMGRLHEDGEIIAFPWKHYHIDWRFVAARIIGADYGGSFPFGLSRSMHVYARPLLTWPRLNSNGLPPPVMRRRKFQREHTLPFDARRITWLPKLEAAHAGCKLAAGMVCPHRGYDLTHEPVDANGHVICPMHGLRWNAVTGELAPRAT